MLQSSFTLTMRDNTTATSAVFFSFRNTHLTTDIDFVKYQPFRLNEFANRCHSDNRTWWVDLSTGEPIERNKGELIALMHSELSEALEGVRKNLQDEKLPHRKAEEVELADALIRIFDYAGAYGLDLDGAFWEKRDYNAKRADHKAENRIKENGKKF